MNPPHIAYESGVLRLIDQTQIPRAIVVSRLTTVEEVAGAIRGMKVRGAPAIGIAGAYGMAMCAAASAAVSLSAEDFMNRMTEAARHLSAARPTAVNLSWAVNAVLALLAQRSLAGEQPAAMAAVVEAYARKIHADDIETCRRIGDAGAELLAPDGALLTHCNTGSLATGGYGTALGVIRSAWHAGKLKMVWVDETRPLLQGARLTTWELAQDSIPHTLIADAMAAHFMRRGLVSAVIVGADRIARNGDTANKIGTYGLAVLAHAHGIPFYVAAPSSTCDGATATGDDIIIEERSPDEVTSMGGVRLTPADTHAANPAFDITPAKYITAIVTEFGVLRAEFSQSIAAMRVCAAPRDGVTTR
ncbi:MAG: S-methyl-5-thioribose-1-phosphate isomerase [Candidatus Eremiobacteraeota bacterium]|nr:S-methyl-5-thioribose-1-phosphate isomerase [Candidatus Eremiobacteraeota bacterium]MBC5827740.1 S-methyl-5-thioribose-1-phosphate isomerase [Candidatus Eremiobacteraeota bacterium]